MVKKAAAHGSAVIKGILFIGFSIQIIVGIVWMCCNFTRIQAFPATDAVIYSGLFRLVGECAPVMYILQLAAAFAVNYFCLQSLAPAGRWFAVWRTLALLTVPFAMQCHLALQPHSFVGTLFLGALLLAAKALQGKKGWCLACVCLVGAILMSGIVDEQSREDFSNRGLEGIMAGRMGWYTVSKDYEYWPEELQEMTAEVYFEANFAPNNMELLLEKIESAVGPVKAKEYYGVIAQIGWENNMSAVLHQMAWDVLGYTVSPIVVPMQLDGRAYDSYTGRNYESMREAFPRLTKGYVEYGCWWFAVTLILLAAGSALKAVVWRHEVKAANSEGSARGVFRRVILPVGLCLVLSGIWVLLLTLRGSGMMDYKWSFAVNELWLIWAMLLMGKMGAE